MSYFRYFWLGVYVVAAIVSAGVFAVRGKLGGDFSDVLLPDFITLFIATSCVVVSYLVWMGPVFRIMEKIPVFPVFNQWQGGSLPKDGRLVSSFVFLLQFAFLVYCLAENIGMAGSTNRTDSVVKYVWIFFPVDAIFLVYYGLYRKSRWFAPNVIVYTLSNVLRGWFGFWLIIIFLEGCYRLREKKMNLKKILLPLIVFIGLIPYLIEIKWLLRQFGFSILSKPEHIFNKMMLVNWWESLLLTIERTLMRLQHLDNVIVIIDNAAILREKLNSREYLNFFEEGLPQFTIERIIGWERIPDLHIRLIEYFAVHRPTIEGVITNTHTGFVAWLWIMPTWWPIYFAYALLLSWLGIFLARKLGGTGLLIDVVWLAWLSWLMNGWFGAYIDFLQALVIVIVVKVLISKLSDNEKVVR